MNGHPEAMVAGTARRGADGPDRGEVDLAAALSRAASGETDALASIYDAVGDEMFGLALCRTRSREDAADVVQDVFLRLARGGPALRRVRKPRPYLLGMVHRAAIDLVRKRRRHDDLEDALLEPRDERPETRADAAVLSARLAELPPAQREAVWLRHFGELSFAEIGVATGVPTFTAASRYRLGIGRLRRHLGVES